MRSTGGSAVGVLLASHIGALLGTGRVGVVGAELRAEGRGEGSAGIRARRRSVGEGRQRITGNHSLLIFEQGSVTNLTSGAHCEPIQRESASCLPQSDASV